MKRHKSNSIHQLNESSSTEATRNVQANAEATNEAKAEERLLKLLLIHVIFQILIIVGCSYVGTLTATFSKGFLLAAADILSAINVIFLIAYGSKGCNAKSNTQLKNLSVFVLLLTVPLVAIVYIGGLVLFICSVYESQYW